MIALFGIAPQCLADIGIRVLTDKIAAAIDWR
jgi:hypothetical protein